MRFMYRRVVLCFLVKQNTAYEWRICEWSSDVCSSDLIAFYYAPAVDDDRERSEAARAILASGSPGTKLITLGALLDRSDGAWRPLPPSPEGTRRTATLIHSSGSTGEPKGAILTEATLMRFWSVEPKVPVIRVVFAPMNHQIGRGQIFSALALGRTAYIPARPVLDRKS